MKILGKSFIAGFLSTFIFHQGLFGLFYLTGLIPVAPFNMTPVGPIGVPSVLSLAFFGGLWGVLIWKLVAKDIGVKHWSKSIVFGAIGPTAVAMLVVFPLKGIDVKLIMIVFGLILNGFWGFGHSLLMRMKLFTIKF